MTDDPVTHALSRARTLARTGQDEAAKSAYLDALRLDPTRFDALNELGTLAFETGHRSAARTAYAQAIACHPTNPVARINLGNLLLEDRDFPGAEAEFRTALRLDPMLAEAHQGLAHALAETDPDAAERHRRLGFTGNAVVNRPFRGAGPGIPLLLLVDARGGNMPTRHWIDERVYAVTALYPEFADLDAPLPPHAIVVNAISDADRAPLALDRAETLLARTTAPVVNPPARIRPTSRIENARRLAAIPGIVTAHTRPLSRDTLDATELRFPILLRAPGFHTGQHFLRVPDAVSLPAIAATLPGDTLLAIDDLEARSPDGLYRKYRVLFIDGALYPLHLAISPDWKVHYFTAAMAASPDHRDEERRFLEDLPASLGPRATAALHQVADALGLDYAGIDFALAADGSVLLFEANSTMAILEPGPDPIWDYRRAPICAALDAARHMLARRAAR